MCPLCVHVHTHKVLWKTDSHKSYFEVLTANQLPMPILQYHELEFQGPGNAFARHPHKARNSAASHPLAF